MRIWLAVRGEGSKPGIRHRVQNSAPNLEFCPVLGPNPEHPSSVLGVRSEICSERVVGEMLESCQRTEVSDVYLYPLVTWLLGVLHLCN